MSDSRGKLRNFRLSEYPLKISVEKISSLREIVKKKCIKEEKGVENLKFRVDWKSQNEEIFMSI